MLRRLLDYQLELTKEGKPLNKIKPLINATDTFLYEVPLNTKNGPHIRDAIDIKRWMVLVVVALIPCLLWGIWNTGLQKFVYASGDFKLMNEYLTSSQTFQGYIDFAAKDNRYLTFIWLGLAAVVPLLIITYTVGGLWEALFAIVRNHEISEGFLVTGILYVLILPATIPYWMAAVGVSAGIILGKEVFGGSGMNIVNPAIACRAFLFFGFPGRMSGDVWVGTNPTTIRQSLVKMNQDAGTNSLDAYSQATPLAKFNINHEIERIHTDAIATNNLGENVSTIDAIRPLFNKWNSLGNHQAQLGSLTQDQMQNFVTSPLSEGGLGLSSGYYDDAYNFSSLNYGIGHNSDWNAFFGDKLGCIGETSTFACILGALFMIWTGVASWRTMVAMGLGAYITALCFQWGSNLFGTDGGAWSPASFGFPAYKHLIYGGLAFGLVFMATDPVSSPTLKGGQWIFGLLCGLVTVVIRVINPAYPEGVMLAILMGNVFAPLIDHYVSQSYVKRRMKRVRATAS